jgi:hypothetical protein
MRIRSTGRGRARHFARLPRPLVDAEDTVFNEPLLAWQPRP